MENDEELYHNEKDELERGIIDLYTEYFKADEPQEETDGDPEFWASAGGVPPL